jgi:3-methyladenine DNA glycosylase/8-oxoguanine DNA glycosylase
VEEVRDGAYRRTARAGAEALVVELRPGPGGAHLRAEGGGNPKEGGLERGARLLLDLDADPAAVSEALGADELLRPLVRARPGLRVPGAWDGFELAVRAVLGQQVSVPAARTLAARICAELGEPLGAVAGSLTRLFPSPAALARVELAGMPGSRARAVRALAAAVAAGLRIEPGRDPGAVRAALLELPGIGPWTVEYVAMRALGDRDAFPAGDLVLRRALGGASEAEALVRAEAWRPFRAYAAMYLWTASGAQAGAPVSSSEARSSRTFSR